MRSRPQIVKIVNKQMKNHFTGEIKECTRNEQNGVIYFTNSRKKKQYSGAVTL